MTERKTKDFFWFQRLSHEIFEVYFPKAICHPNDLQLNGFDPTALLLPALTKAKAQAQNVRCKSNLRQMGIALRMYVEDYKHYPFWETISPIATYWESCLDPYYRVGWWRDKACQCPSYTGAFVPFLIGGSRVYDPPEPSRISQSYGYNVMGTSSGTWTSLSEARLGLGSNNSSNPSISYLAISDSNYLDLFNPGSRRTTARQWNNDNQPHPETWRLHP